MPDSKRDWNGRYFFCSRDGLGVPSRRVGDDASWFWQYLGHRQIFKFSTVYIFTFFFIYLSQVFNVIHFSLFSASVRPHITDKQEALIRWVLEIPFDERRCKDLITLDTLHTYFGGPEPTLVARKLNAYSYRRKLYFLFFSSHCL